jgi:hypothetical protein
MRFEVITFLPQNDPTSNYSSNNSPVRVILYDTILSGFLNQECLCDAKLSISGVGITGIIPILMIDLPGIISTFDMTGLLSSARTTWYAQLKNYLLSIHRAEIAIYRVTAVGGFVFVNLERSVSISNVDFVFLHDEIC